MTQSSQNTIVSRILQLNQELSAARQSKDLAAAAFTRAFQIYRTAITNHNNVVDELNSNSSGFLTYLATAPRSAILQSQLPYLKDAIQERLEIVRDAETRHAAAKSKVVALERELQEAQALLTSMSTNNVQLRKVPTNELPPKYEALALIDLFRGRSKIALSKRQTAHCDAFIDYLYPQHTADYPPATIAAAVILMVVQKIADPTRYEEMVAETISTERVNDAIPSSVVAIEQCFELLDSHWSNFLSDRAASLRTPVAKEGDRVDHWQGILTSVSTSTSAVIGKAGKNSRKFYCRIPAIQRRLQQFFKDNALVDLEYTHYDSIIISVSTVEPQNGKKEI